MIPLRTALRINSVFSLASGAGLAVGASLLEGVLGVDAIWLVAVGVGVVLFGVVVGRIAAGRPVPRQAARGVIVADLMWVIGAAALIFGFPELLSTAGKWTLGIISTFVLDFAILQAVALQQPDPSGLAQS